MSIFFSFICTFKRKKYLRSQLGRKYQEKKERQEREKEGELEANMNWEIIIIKYNLLNDSLKQFSKINVCYLKK